MIEAWEEEQMSNLGCESVSDLIAEVKRLREGIEQLYESIGTMETQGNIAIRKALKEMLE